MQIKSIINKALSNTIGYKLIKADIDLGIQSKIESSYGHQATKRTGKPTDKDGNPIPWYTYPATEFLSQFSLKEKEIFEWGCGNSSLFFSARAKKVISIEADEQWSNYIKNNSPVNQVVMMSSEEDFPAKIMSFDQTFDIIVIDSLRRFDCCKLAPKKLNIGGLIILDNSDWYPNSCKVLRDSGFVQIDMSGFGPVNDFTWVTSFFFKESYDLPLMGMKQPHTSVGGIDQQSRYDY